MTTANLFDFIERYFTTTYKSNFFLAIEIACTSKSSRSRNSRTRDSRIIAKETRTLSPVSQSARQTRAFPTNVNISPTRFAFADRMEHTNIRESKLREPSV